MAARRPFCARESRDRGEPLTATASQIESWLLVEYRGGWHRDILGGSHLSEPVKAHLRGQLDALPRSRLLFIRRRARRAEPGLRVYFGRTGERESRFFTLELESYGDLLGLDFAGEATRAAALEHPLLVVCTHGRRDRCCATYGRPLYDYLRGQPERDWVWQSTHVGGDRFAGNLVCFPEGLYFGHLGSEDARRALDAYRAGEIWLARYRGRSCYPFAVQAAEQAVRKRTGLVGIDDLELVAVEPNGDGWRVAFRAVASGERHEADVVAETEGEPAYLTCSAEELRRARRYRAR